MHSAYRNISENDTEIQAFIKFKKYRDDYYNVVLAQDIKEYKEKRDRLLVELERA